MDKNLLALRSGLFGESTVDGTLRERERRAIRIGVVDDIVQRASGRFMESISRELLRRPVHEHTVLPLIHQKYGHGCIAEDAIEPSGRVPEFGLDATVVCRVLDRRIVNGIIAIDEQLQLHSDIVIRSIFPPVNGVKVEPFDFPRLKRLNQGEEGVAANDRLDIPRRQTGQLFDAVSQIIPGTLVHKPEPEILCAEYIDLARGSLDDAAKTFTRHTCGVWHAGKLSLQREK